jgi:hypothetical protein
MTAPGVPDADTRERLLDVLGELVARGGAARLLAAPVAPGPEAFPEPWAPTRAGVALLLRRLLWHAGIEREVTIEDRRMAGAPPTERKPATRVELLEVGSASARFALGFVGDDDVVGTLAHEIGIAFAALHRPDDADPYRTAEPPVIAVDLDRDLVRGSIATVYLGLGVLAANAAYQQYSRSGRFNGGYVPLEYDVLHAGHVEMSDLAFLLAVQAVVCGDTVPPPGLSGPQRDEVAAWLSALRGQRAELCARLGLPAEPARGERPAPITFAGAVLEDEPTPPKVAFRWQTHRGGLGLVAGTMLGLGVAFAISRGMLPYGALGGATTGHVIGRRVRAQRCSSCVSIVATQAQACRSCGARLRGDIATLGERLEAEERLEDDPR